MSLTKIRKSNIEPSIRLPHTNAAFDTANSASSYANSAYDVSNTTNTLAQAAYDAANNAVDTWVRDAANSASSYANGAFAGANTSASVSSYANAAFDVANSASSYANGAFDAANNAVDTWVRDAANSASSYANGAFDSANNNIGSINNLGNDIGNLVNDISTTNSTLTTVGLYANAAFETANNASSAGTDGWARDTANSASSYANGAFTVANSAQSDATTTETRRATTGQYANAAFFNANNKLSSSGGTINGSLIVTGNITLSTTSTFNANTTRITNVGEPTQTSDAATKQYVDTIAAASLHYHEPVRVESPTALTATYNNGSSGVGATLTNSGTQSVLSIDGVTLNVNDRVLIYQQTNAVHNGVYVVTNVGSGSTNWILTRSTDTDSYAPSDPNSFGQGDAFYVKEGATGAGELYVMNTEGSITFGTTAITFSQISSAQIYSAGAGLTLSGTQFSISTDLDNEITVIFDSANSASSYANSAFAVANSAPSKSVSNIFTAKQTFLGSGNDISIVSDNYAENVSIVAAAATGTINFEIGTYSVLYYTSNASGNQTLNFRISSTSTLNSQLEVGQSISVTFIVTNGATPYYPSAHQIDGSAVTPRWADGTAVTAGNANSTDVYSYSIIKTAATPTYILLANQTRFA